MKRFKRLLFTFLAFFGLVVNYTADKVEIRKFLKKLHPIQSSHPLIRFGSSNDGGYLVPNDFREVTGCFSPGVSTIANFENDMAKLGIPCFMADASVDSPPGQSSLFTFTKNFIKPSSSSNSLEINDWIRANIPQLGDQILQMDIEGDEYFVLLAIEENFLSRFRYLIVEFHNFDLLYTEFGLKMMTEVFDKLLKFFKIVHIHPNNNDPIRRVGDISIPSLLEITFERSDRISKLHYVSNFPNPLDHPTLMSKKEIILPRIFYSS